MAIKGEVYRIYESEGYKDVDIVGVADNADVVDFIVSEVENIDGVSVGDTASVDISTVEHHKLYDADGEPVSN